MHYVVIWNLLIQDNWFRAIVVEILSYFTVTFLCFIFWKILSFSIQWVRPSSDVELFTELSTWKVRRLNQLGMPVSIWKGLAVLLAHLASTLDRLWNGFDSDAELFMCRTKCINYYVTYFLSNFTEMNIFLLLNLVGSALIRIRFGSRKVRHLNRA